MSDEEKIIEINITIDKPLVLVLLLIVIIFKTGYIGYTQFFQNRESIGPATDVEEPENPVEQNSTIINLDEEPESFEELKAYLVAYGCENIINLDSSEWRGKLLEANYTHALTLAKESPVVFVDENILGFFMYVDGMFYIWLG